MCGALFRRTDLNTAKSIVVKVVVTKPWSRIITENFLNLVHVIFEICERTDRPTDTLIANEYRPKYGDALRLGSKGRMAHSIRG